MRESKIRSRKAGKPPTHYLFTGVNKSLVTGATYTITEMAAIIGINDKTMHSRMKNKSEFTDKEVGPTQTAFGGNNSGREGLYDRLETTDMKLSDKWLRVKL